MLEVESRPESTEYRTCDAFMVNLNALGGEPVEQCDNGEDNGGRLHPSRLLRLRCPGVLHPAY